MGGKIMRIISLLAGVLMGVEKGEIFSCRDVYINYNFEGVAFRWDFLRKKIYVKFYGKSEKREPISHENKLFNDALLYGEEISKGRYDRGYERK